MADKLIKTLNFGTGDTYHLAPEWDNIQNKPEDIGGGGGKADSVDWEDVQNKPFGYDYDNPIILLDNRVIESEDGMYGLAEELPLEAGVWYTINYNGTEYEAVAEDMYGSICLGNAGLIGETESDYPFFIMSAGELGCVIMDVYGSTEPLTLTIKTYPVTKIDPKFIKLKKTYCVFHNDEDKHLYEDAGFTTKITLNDFVKDLNDYACFVIDVYEKNTMTFAATLMPLLLRKDLNENYEGYYTVFTYSGEYVTTT